MIKLRQLLIALTLCASLTAVAIQANSPQQQTTQQQTVEELQQQIDQLEKEVEIYREDVRAKSIEINDSLDHWINVLAIIMAIVGIAMPLILNIQAERRIQRQLEEATQKAESASQQVKDIEKIKKTIESIQQKVDKSEKAAEQSKIDAKQAAKDAETKDAEYVN